MLCHVSSWVICIAPDLAFEIGCASAIFANLDYGIPILRRTYEVKYVKMEQ